MRPADCGSRSAVVAGAVTVGAQQRAPEPTRVASPRADTMRPRDSRDPRHRRGRAALLGLRRRSHPAAGRQRGRRRRRLGARRVGLRDLALRFRRRSADDDLRREDQGDHRHQRPGSGAEGGDARAVRRARAGARQRSARRDDPGDARRDGARARSQGHDAPRAGDAAGDRARRRLPDVRVPAQLLRQRAQGDRAVGVVEEDLLPRRPRAGGRRDLPAAEPGAHAARDRRAPTRRRSRRPATASPRSAPAATRSTKATSRTASPTPTRPPAASSATTISRRYHGAIEKPVTTNFHGYDVYKAGPWNQGPVLLQTLNILEGVDLKSLGANSTDYIHQVHEAIKLAYADRNAYYGDPAFATVPIAGLLSKAYAAERRGLIGAAGVARAARRRSVQVRSDGEGAGRRLHAALAGRRRPARPPATRPASTSSTRTATSSARRRARAGCWRARSSPATPACRCRTG